MLTTGWSEPAATNAPVANELIEAVFRMNENPILPARIYIFFPLLLYPKNFPPPTYHLPTPPPLHSIARAPETSSASELGAGAWSRGVGLASYFFFSPLFCLFVCEAALQRSIAKKATLRCNRLLLLLCVAAQLHKKGDNSYRCLLLSAMELRCSSTEEGDFVVELRCVAAQRSRRRQQRCSAVPRRRRRQLPSPSSLLGSCAAAQRHEEGDSNCQLPSPSSFCYGAVLQRSEVGDGSNDAVAFFSFF